LKDFEWVASELFRYPELRDDGLVVLCPVFWLTYLFGLYALGLTDEKEETKK